jgi:hypothetical protein
VTESIGNSCKKHIFVRGLPLPSDPLPKGFDYPEEKLAEDIG